MGKLVGVEVGIKVGEGAVVGGDVGSAHKISGCTELRTAGDGRGGKGTTL